VRLFPRESSSCPARTSCYHISAARLAVGLSDSGTRSPLNLTRRNKRRRAVKTSGRKRPRADIVPAGDVATGMTATITVNQQQQQPPPSPTPADVEPSSPPAPSSPTPTFRQATQDDATKALGQSRGSSTGYSVTPAASGCTMSARALDAPHPSICVPKLAVTDLGYRGFITFIIINF